MSTPEYGISPNNTRGIEYRAIEHLVPAIERWAATGRGDGGGFLSAVFANDLRGAVSAADERNAQLLPLIVRFLHNRVPSARLLGSARRFAVADRDSCGFPDGWREDTDAS